jgi:hypothetical protein
MHKILTEEECFLLNLLADGPIEFGCGFSNLTNRLVTMQLVTLDEAGKWRLTLIGKAMLDKRHQQLH